jgi:hypothetical protein
LLLSRHPFAPKLTQSPKDCFFQSGYALNFNFPPAIRHDSAISTNKLGLLVWILGGLSDGETGKN